MTNSTQFTDRVYVITGAASGMGEATTQALLDQGGVVYACDRNPQILQKFQSHDKCVQIELDIRYSDQCTELVEKIWEKYHQINGLVNFAGVLKRTGLLECTDEDFDYVMQVNVYGCFYMLRAVASKMVTQGYGSIVNVSSIWSDIGASGVLAYCASKGAVSQLTRSAALDLAQTGVRVNEIRPGETNTPMLASERGAYFSQEQVQQKLRQIASTIPIERLAKPDEIAQAALFLLSDQSSYMMGSHITVDGGYTAR